MPAIASARRLLFAPLELGWVRRGGGETRDVAVLGRGDGARLLLRFSVPLVPEASVVEAYVLLSRAPAIDADPALLSLHAARVTSPWDTGSLSWARQPTIEEVGAPVTRVAPASGALVRVDVREIVQRWRRRSGGDFGIAIVSEGTSPTGVAVALAPMDIPEGRADPVLARRPALATLAPSAFDVRTVAPGSVADARRQVGGPCLELYVH